jgi:AmmeMemoRadiSam system protein A
MPFLSEADRREVLNLARRAIAEAVVHDRLLESIPHLGVFAERCGVFVSVHVYGKLRGCIGVIEDDAPLAENIARCASSAAMHDTRFAPLRPEELANLEIEISLLSSPAPIAMEEIEIGRHGLLIRQGERRGLLLPQVATEHHFDRERFLEQTCRKAGLPATAWKDAQTQLFAFTCEVFSDSG